RSWWCRRPLRFPLHTPWRRGRRCRGPSRDASFDPCTLLLSQHYGLAQTIIQGYTAAYRGPVHVGLSISGLIQQARGRDMQARLREILDWVGWARDAGFDYITTGQH